MPDGYVRLGCNQRGVRLRRSPRRAGHMGEFRAKRKAGVMTPRLCSGWRVVAGFEPDAKRLTYSAPWARRSAPMIADTKRPEPCDPGRSA